MRACHFSRSLSLSTSQSERVHAPANKVSRKQDVSGDRAILIFGRTQLPVVRKTTMSCCLNSPDPQLKQF